MKTPPFKRVAIDGAARGLPFTERLLSRLPEGMPVHDTEGGAPPPGGRSTLYVTVRNGPFLKRCPCTPGAVDCGYYVFTPAFMCPFACSYCFLRFYAPDEPLTLYANLEDAEREFRETASALTRTVRMGTGEFADSLALEPWTGHASWIYGLVRDFPNVLMELKTKSAEVDAFLATPPLPNLIAAWSLNPPSFAETDESFAATVEERLLAAGRTAAAGRPVAFHFDPVVMVPDWKDKYSGLVNNLFNAVPPESIRWISLGTLRFPKRFLDERGPALRGNPIYFDEFIPGEDGKLRYFWPERREVYRFMRETVNARSGGTVPVYLCMESPSMWESAMGCAPGEGEVEAALTVTSPKKGD